MKTMLSWLVEHGFLQIITLLLLLIRLEKIPSPSIRMFLEIYSREKNTLKIVLKVFKGTWKEWTLSDNPFLKKNSNKNIIISSSKKRCFSIKNQGRKGLNSVTKIALFSMLKPSSEGKETEFISFSYPTVSGPPTPPSFKKKLKHFSRTFFAITIITMTSTLMRALTPPWTTMTSIL